MAQLQWFKFYGGEYLSDPKIMSLTPCERSCLLTLFCLASVSEIPGEIKYLDEYKLMMLAGLSFDHDEWDETLGVLDKFQKLNIATLNDNGIIKVNNFRKKQDIALTNYERVKKYRENKKVNDNEMITNDNGVKQIDNTRREEKRKDKKEKEKEKEVSSLKKGKPFYDDQEMRLKNGKYFVIPKEGGSWLEFVGEEKEIEWRK